FIAIVSPVVCVDLSILATTLNKVERSILNWDLQVVSKKMQKYILKQQFEGFSVSNSEGLHKGYESLLSQLEIHGAGADSLSFDDLYNNLRFFESDVKGSTASSSSTQNVAFVSENTSSTNDASTAYGVSNSSGHNSQYEHPSSYSLLANQSRWP
ncbi:hypothetical protein Tco_0207790, partial [Tanacetum coccineum]